MNIDIIIGSIIRFLTVALFGLFVLPNLLHQTRFKDDLRIFRYLIFAILGVYYALIVFVAGTNLCQFPVCTWIKPHVAFYVSLGEFLITVGWILIYQKKV